MCKNLKIIIFTAIAVGLESDNSSWYNSFERYYPTTTGFINSVDD